jgi:hypothetical protein
VNEVRPFDTARANVINIVATDDGQLMFDAAGTPSRRVALQPDRLREPYGERQLVLFRDSGGQVVNVAFSSNPSVASEWPEGLNAPMSHTRVLVALPG